VARGPLGGGRMGLPGVPVAVARGSSRYAYRQWLEEPSHAEANWFASPQGPESESPRTTPLPASYLRSTRVLFKGAENALRLHRAKPRLPSAPGAAFARLQPGLGRKLR